MQSNLPIASERASPRPATLILLCACSVLPLSLFLPSLPAIARDLRADYALVALSLGGYAVVAASLEFVMGPLSDRFGRRPVVLASVGVFALGSLGCAMATDIRAFLTCRLMQAAITSVYPVSMATIRDTGGGARAASRIGYAAMAAAFAPMLGPTFGGALDQALGWRASFWLLGAVGIALFVWCAFDLVETHANRSSSLGQQLRAYPALLRARRFWAYALCMAFSTGAFYAFWPARRSRRKRYSASRRRRSASTWGPSRPASCAAASWPRVTRAATHWPRRFCSDGRSRARGR